MRRRRTRRQTPAEIVAPASFGVIKDLGPNGRVRASSPVRVRQVAEAGRIAECRGGQVGDHELGGQSYDDFGDLATRDQAEKAVPNLLARHA